MRQIVIEVSDEDAVFLMNSSFIPVKYFEAIHKAIHNGILLPKTHGRLADIDDLSNITVGCKSDGTLSGIYAPTVVPGTEGK